MKMVKWILAAVFVVFGSAATASIETAEIEYQVEGESFTGYLAYRDDGQLKPGVLVVHEWWGHNDYARKRAEQLAELGYVAFALDMYGSGKVADHPKQAGEFMNAVFAKAGAAKARFEAAMTVLQSSPQIAKERVAAIGYCFGGAVVLNMARAGLDLKGVASFHGALATQTPAQQGAVSAKVLVLHGNDDAMVTPQNVADFKTEMDGAGVDYEFIGYDGALHSFTNPAADAVAKQFDMPIAYDAEADADSWARLQRFLETVFQ